MSLTEAIATAEEFPQDSMIGSLTEAVRRWDAFPSDEDVEAAAKDYYEDRLDSRWYRAWGELTKAEQRHYTRRMRAALLAVKARETDR